MKIAEIHTKKGVMKIKFFEKDAPNTVKNFIDLANKGFYNGLTFHRVIPNFVIQGGCPKGDGTGGPGWNIKAEFNDRQHVPGVLSMARSAHPDSAGSQFFVCLTREHCQHLDREYTAFGKVTKGMDVIEKIAATPLRDPRGGTPAKAPRMTKVTVNAAQPAGR